MLTILSAMASLASFRFRRRVSLELEVLALRHQLAVFHRQRPGRAWLGRGDRLLRGWLYRIWPRCLEVMVLVKPANVVQWHRRGFRKYWRWRSRSRRAGRPEVNREIRELIRQMSLANELWGAPRIHGEMLKLDIEVRQATVGRHMVRRHGSPSPTWRTFLCNQVDGIAAIDMFEVVTAAFRPLYVSVILSHARRKILHLNVTDHPTAGWLSRQITEAFPVGHRATLPAARPRHIVQGMLSGTGSGGITEVVTTPRSPWQNPYLERVIGSIRRECLDHVIVINESHLRRVLSSYIDYYQRTRTHLSLDKDCPDARPIQQPNSGKVIAIPQVGGLHHRYQRLAA
jgi:putative transposase